MKRILVVEDNRLERRLLVRLLDTFIGDKAKVDDVSEGASALNYMSNLKYDLIITDLIMPKMEGLELIMQIKRHFADSRIIAISGNLPYYLHLAKNLGVDGIFTKPINGEKFAELVINLLQ
jgi:CheY-like chemotaxis protein